MYFSCCLCQFPNANRFPVEYWLISFFPLCFLGREGAFRKLRQGVEINLLNTRYDYTSVMHYGAYGFAVDRNVPTIVPLDRNARIGQRARMSALDIERVQLLYGCKRAVS